MNEVMISKKRLLVWLLPIIVLAVVGLGFFLLKPAVPNRENARNANLSTPSSTTDNDQPAQVAALAGAQAFYTVDYQSQQTWVDKLCAISTAIGCTVDRNTLAPTLWSDFVKNQTTTTAKATIQNKVLDQVLPGRGNARAQVWRMQLDLSAPWPQQAQPLTHFPALALVIQEQGSWKFERFLTEEEASVYEKGNQP